ncbi:flippase-like domain-containing protein [Desulfobacterota bacterium AH_259_B03_O07]|nr:flippase-like domain-containing protein [Desulfobacterota bacterium AH_259_B03_O07]
MKIIIGIAFSIIFLVLALYKANFDQIGKALIGVKLHWLILAALVYVATFIPRSLRWQRLLLPIKSLRVKCILPVLIVGYMANNILPLRMGELFRAHFLKEKEEVSGSSALATILVERVFDGLTLVLLLAVVLVFSPQKKWVHDLGWAAGAIFFTILIGIFLLTRYEGYIRNISLLSRHNYKSLGKWLTNKFEAFLIGLRGISSPDGFAIVWIFSALIWLLEGLVIYLIILAFGLSLSLAHTALVLVIINFSTMIPSGPGFIGTFQFAFVLSFALFGIKKEMAIAVSIITQLVFFIIVNPVGIGLLWKHNLSLRRTHRSLVKLDDLS